MITNIIVSGMLTFLVTFFLKELDGPFDLFANIRHFLCRYTLVPVDGSNSLVEKHYHHIFWFKLFDCFWCLATWCCVPSCLIVWLIIGYPVIQLVVVIPASIVVAGIINKFVMM